MRQQQKQEFDEKKKALKDRLGQIQALKNAQFLRTNDFKTEHDYRKHLYTESALQTPFFLHRYKINLNSCFECSLDQLQKDIFDYGKLQNVTGQVYFQLTKRMTEFSKKRGFDGRGKFCALCARECTYIASYEMPSAQAVEPGLA